MLPSSPLPPEPRPSRTHSSNLSRQLKSLRAVFSPPWGSSLPPTPSSPLARTRSQKTNKKRIPQQQQHHHHPHDSDSFEEPSTAKRPTQPSPVNAPSTSSVTRPIFIKDLRRRATTDETITATSPASHQTPSSPMINTPSRAPIQPGPLRSHSSVTPSLVPLLLQSFESGPKTPPTVSSGPSCRLCRATLSRSSSDSSVFTLGSHTPLFDDLLDTDVLSFAGSSNLHSVTAEEDAIENRDGDPVPGDSASDDLSSSLESDGAPSKSSPRNNGRWWDDLPAHRKALIIEAESWPIFTPHMPHSSSTTTLAYSLPTCPCSLPSHASGPRMFEDSELHPSLKDDEAQSCPGSPEQSTVRSQRSFSSGLNVLVPTPLEADEQDPLLFHSYPDPIVTSEPPESTDTGVSEQLSTDIKKTNSKKSHGSHQSTIRRRKKKEDNALNQESLLTKSLRRWSMKLPNIQFGNLNLLTNLVEGTKRLPQESESEGSDELLAGMIEDENQTTEEDQINRLVKSWTSDTIQPQNSLNGRFINDPEMEWSSMMVQMKSFSPSDKKTHGKKEMNMKPLKAYKNGPKKKKKISEEDKWKDSEESVNSQRKEEGGEKKRRRRVIVNKRLVSNPYHLLQLSLELEMMRNRKIRSPLKQRAIKLIVEKKIIYDENVDQIDEVENGMNFGFNHPCRISSKLRYEIV